jgi:rare lipoprotein A
MMGLRPQYLAPAVLALAFALGLGGCAQTKIAVHAAKQVTRAVAPPSPPPPTPDEAVGEYKIGEPYEIAGVWYYPKEDPDYDQTGIASWYGHPFHGRSTASGETFDMNRLSAAHKTLPLPTVVTVTNLENGRSLRLRVNDRGPFVHGRIIDVSRRAAQLLGFQRNGTARVRVRVAGASSGGFILAKPETPEEERTALAAVPREAVASEPLPPPQGAAAPQPEAEQPPPRVASAPPQPAPASSGPVLVVLPVRPTQLFIQAGAFSYYDNARRLGSKLSGMGPTVISTTTVGGKRFYRVRIGPLDTLDVADNTLERVIQSGYPGARLVVD